MSNIFTLNTSSQLNSTQCQCIENGRALLRHYSNIIESAFSYTDQIRSLLNLGTSWQGSTAEQYIAQVEDLHTHILRCAYEAKQEYEIIQNKVVVS
ncbi:MAG: hypothetical protein Q3961_04105 [Bifidobacteriaceae bacterium]|nr:hypothetical protein [Bifidobacteriaceae bacterium]